nr:uncharacterized mitochondrial protein AtMg00810-like [Tanacetum cinerariifolium]
MFALLKPTFLLRPLQLTLVLHSKAERSHSFGRALSPVHLRCSIREKLLALGSSGISPNHNSSVDSSTSVDADHAGCHLDRKSTPESVQFLGDKLVCWSSKKQNCVSISTAESEYVTVSSCFAQVLWMRTQLTDYGFFYDKLPIYCDSKSAIAISCYLWKSRIKRYIDTKPNHELIHYCLTNPPYELGWKEKFVLDSEGNPTTTTEKVFETCKNVTQEIRDQLNTEAEIVQIIFTGIDNDIYSTVDTCPNACEMWKAIERLKQVSSNKSSSEYSVLTSITTRMAKDNSPQIHKNAGYEQQRLGNVAGARETIGSTVVQKSRIQCYNCKEYGHVARECQKQKRAKDAAYHREKMLLCKQEEAGIQLNVEQADWKDDTDDESDDQELEAHYMYMAKIQQVSPDVDDSGPIFDKEPEQK